MLNLDQNYIELWENLKTIPFTHCGSIEDGVYIGPYYTNKKLKCFLLNQEQGAYLFGANSPMELNQRTNTLSLNELAQSFGYRSLLINETVDESPISYENLISDTPLSSKIINESLVFGHKDISYLLKENKEKDLVITLKPDLSLYFSLNESVKDEKCFPYIVEFFLKTYLKSPIQYCDFLFGELKRISHQISIPHLLNGRFLFIKEDIRNSLANNGVRAEKNLVHGHTLLIFPLCLTKKEIHDIFEVIKKSL